MPPKTCYTFQVSQIHTTPQVAVLDDVLRTIVERIVDAVKPDAIILFGSHALDSSQSDSDIDLLIIESAPFAGARSRLREIGRIELAIGSIPVPTDVVVYSRDEVERFRGYPNHVVSHALNEGRVLYDARR